MSELKKTIKITRSIEYDFGPEGLKTIALEKFLVLYPEERDKKHQVEIWHKTIQGCGWGAGEDDYSEVHVKISRKEITEEEE